MKPQHEVAHIVHRFHQAYHEQYAVPAQVSKTLNAIGICRTEALGGHTDVCTSCGVLSQSYNSCRNRHCPKCQATNRERWITARERELLPVPYYHMVFTLPHCFNELLPKYAKAVYNSLFTASWHTIQSFAADPKYLGAKTGMVAVLHTWGQQLWLHPHVHCIVPGGGITQNGKWRHCRYRDKYLYPKRALSLVFRAKFMKLLREQINIPQAIARQAFAQKWVVYAKRPFASPKNVVEYLGRYTHKVAISNHRLLNIDQDKVSFTYKDYRSAATKKTATISGVEFLRRFSYHVLPKGFMRIRHYGFLAGRNKPKELNLAKADLGQQAWQKMDLSWQQVAEEKLGIIPNTCPHCKTQTMVCIATQDPKRGPPGAHINKNSCAITLH